jgi:hypothetical protein
LEERECNSLAWEVAKWRQKSWAIWIERGDVDTKKFTITKKEGKTLTLFESFLDHMDQRPTLFKTWLRIK